MSKIREFIDKNKLSFIGNGSGINSSVCTIIGYSQFLELSQEDLEKELTPEIKKNSEVKKEIDRLWNYCDNSAYSSFWYTSKAKEQYHF